MKLIVAVNKKNFIGRDGQMLWRCKEDLKHFKEQTLNTKCLVGRKTFESLPTLRNRSLVVVGSKYFTLEKALSFKPDWVIGGGEIYKQTVHLCDEIHISHIDDNYEQGDVEFIIPEDYRGTVYHYHFKQD